MSRTRHTPEDEPHFLIRTLRAAFRDGQTLEAHTHDWGQLIYCTEGAVSVWTTGGSWVAPAGWAVWAPAGVAHAMRFTGAATMHMLYVRPGHWPGLPGASAVIAASPLARELILRAIELGMLDARAPAQRAIADLIVSEIENQPAPALDLPLPQTPLLRRIAEHVAQAPGLRAGHARLARDFGIGARTLERGFAAETGLSLGQWRKRARFLQGLRALGSGAAVKEAAREAGYQSASAFIAAFRETLGTTPARYVERV